MKIWIVTLYEPLPLFGEKIRTMRGGFLCMALEKMGVETTLWLPEFDHILHKKFKKKYIKATNTKNISIRIIKGLSYSYDQSPMRYLHNIFLGKELRKCLSIEKNKPNLIVTHIPSLELSFEVAKYSKTHDIPLVVDVRDLWPDIYKRLIPFGNKFIYKSIFRRDIRKLKFILKNSAAITAISENYLQWAIDNKEGIRTEMDKVFYIGYPKRVKNNFDELAENKGKDLFKKHNLNQDDRVIFFSGTFCDSYDFDTIFSICQNEYFKEMGLKFVIAGKGEGAEIIQKFSEKNSNFIYVGWLAKQELEYFLEHSFLAIAPYSRSALMSLPNKPFEYLAHSLPILNSLKGEISDLIKDNNLGKNFSIESEEQLLQSIIYFANNHDEYMKVRGNCLRIHQDQFDSNNIYSEYAQFLEKIASKLI